jgi:dUTP pyrophosphatase
MKVRIKRMDVRAEMPSKKYTSDFCWDVKAVSEEEVAPNVWKYGLGFAAEIEREEMSKRHLYCLSFRPRSSVWKTGMVLSNCVGTIDSDYRGEISAVFYHVMPNMPRYKVGDRIGQIYLSRGRKVEFELAEELGETARGTGGYGSTGK